MVERGGWGRRAFWKINARPRQDDDVVYSISKYMILDGYCVIDVIDRNDMMDMRMVPSLLQISIVMDNSMSSEQLVVVVVAPLMMDGSNLTL